MLVRSFACVGVPFAVWRPAPSRESWSQTATISKEASDPSCPICSLNQMAGMGQTQWYVTVDAVWSDLQHLRYRIVFCEDGTDRGLLASQNLNALELPESTKCALPLKTLHLGDYELRSFVREPRAEPQRKIRLLSDGCGVVLPETHSLAMASPQLQNSTRTTSVVRTLVSRQVKSYGCGVFS